MSVPGRMIRPGDLVSLGPDGTWEVCDRDGQRLRLRHPRTGAYRCTTTRKVVRLWRAYRPKVAS